MPALPDVPNVLRVTYEVSDGTDTSSVVRDYFLYSGGAPTDADCLAIATALYGELVTAIVPQMTSQNELLGVKVVDLTGPSAGVGEYIATTAGSRAGLGLAGGTAVLLNKKIKRRYRGGKPRAYWSLFTADDILTPQTWKTASVSGLQTAFDTYYGVAYGLTEGTTTITSLVNVSYYDGFTTDYNPMTPLIRAKTRSTLRAVPVVDTVTAWSVHGAPASQRRRNQTM